MITDLNKIAKATEESALKITNIEGQLGSIFSLFFRNSRVQKEKELERYVELFMERRELDGDLDVIIDYHIAMQKALETMKLSKQDIKLHSKRIEDMKRIIKNDNYALMSEEEVKEETEMEEAPSVKEEKKTSKKGIFDFKK